jgi:guanine nucleotide-binding protein subunit alpha, other
MSCFGGRRHSASSQGSKKGNGEKKRNDNINKKIQSDRRKESKEVKILLLGESRYPLCVLSVTDCIVGAGESGKSTIIKQMRLIHAGGFSKSERRSWKNVIFHNLVDAFLLVFDILQAYGDHCQDANSEVN